MTAYTPVARTKSAALARVLDLVPRGYSFYTTGEVSGAKLSKLLRKFHERYGIGLTPAQRIARRRKGLANAFLVVYWPATASADPASREAPDDVPDQPAGLATAEAHEDALGEGRELAAFGTRVSWLLLVSSGSGPVWEEERLRCVTEHRLVWLGYELVRHPVRGRAAWTWRRPKEAMEALFALLSEQLNRRQTSAVGETLTRLARQPGFAGVREQSWRLCTFARARGYSGDLPRLYFLQKVSHGERLNVE